MKRSDFYLRLTTAVVFLALVSYIGIYAYNVSQKSYLTAPAISYTLEETVSAEGYIVRVETVVPGEREAVLPLVPDGVRAASGEAVAVEYTSREALAMAGEIRELRLRLEQTETNSDGRGSAPAARESVIALSKAVQDGDLRGLDAIALDVKTNVFENASGPEDDPESLRARLAGLEGRESGVQTIRAPVSGIFSQTVDGFENVRPDSLFGITPSGLNELFAVPSGGTDGAGKLVTGIRWYYAAVMDSSDAARLPVGNSIAVHFTGAYQAAVDMLVESVGRKEDGICVVLFSSDHGISEITHLRFLRAEVAFGAVTGIRVPKEAIHLEDDAGACVFIQTGVVAERVSVEILLEAGDSYLVRDGAETGGPLRAGATIIVKANGLFDGKVIGQ